MSDQYLFLDAQFVKAELGKLFAEYPELETDDELKLSAIEGETNAHKIIERALEASQEAAGMAVGVGSRISDLQERKARHERRVDAMKGLIRNVMQAAQLQKLVLPEATLSVLKPRQTAVIEDESQLPQGFVRIKREPAKAEILKALVAGEEVPGAVLASGSPGLMVRTK